MSVCNDGVEVTVKCVNPTTTDSHIPQTDRLSVAMYNRQGSRLGAKLLLWMNGTQPKPETRHGPVIGPKVGFLKFAIESGYRVISVPFHNENSVLKVCKNNPDRACSENLRYERLYDGPDSIVYQATRLVQYLANSDPSMGWSIYLTATGLDWSKITVVGQSQGAGMAAYIAKQNLVAGAILFSAPADFTKTQHGKELAPWLNWNSKTPPDRWFAAYHTQESGAVMLNKAYHLLRVPEDHIVGFTNNVANGKPHGNGMSDVAHVDDWRRFLGTSTTTTSASAKTMPAMPDANVDQDNDEQ